MRATSWAVFSFISTTGLSAGNSARRGRGGQVVLEPLGGEPGDRRERAGLGEQVIGALDHGQLIRTTQDRARLAVQREHLGVAAADQQQRWRTDIWEAIGGQIGAASA